MEFNAAEASISPDQGMECSFETDDGAYESRSTEGDAATETQLWDCFICLGKHGLWKCPYKGRVYDQEIHFRRKPHGGALPDGSMEMDGQIGSEELPCYICDGNHVVDECLIRLWVDAVLEAEESQNSANMGQEGAGQGVFNLDSSITTFLVSPAS